MKKIFTLFFGMLLMCSALVAQIVPTANDLRIYEQDGHFVACIYFEGNVCNDIVFAGSYNGWDVTDPTSMIKFKALPGFEGWYVAVVPVTVNEDGVEANNGKPVHLAQDGSFSWEYQTGDVDSWKRISGSVVIQDGYLGESDLLNWNSSAPIILRSLYWRNYADPCEVVVKQEYTIYLKAPLCGGYEPAIIGDFNNWNEGVPMDLQRDGYYKAVITSSVGKSIKFKASTDTDWSNEILYSDWGGMFKEWRTLSNYELGSETTIYLDYSTPGYSWTLCGAIDYSSTSKYHNFEDANTSYQWYSLHNYGVNFWTIGTAAGSVDGGSSALYISSNYYEYSYDNSRSSDSWVYLPVTLSQSDEISFSWKGVADSDYDNLQVYLLPKGNVPSLSGVPNAAIPLGEPLAGASDWQKFRAQPDVEGEYYLCFRWINDNNMMGSMPIAIDNVQIGAGAHAQTYDYTIRVKKSAISDINLSNGVWLWWWNTGQDGQWASTTLEDDGWYTATVRSTESTINCLFATYNDWSKYPAQTEDLSNIMGDVCLQIGDRKVDNGQYTLNVLSCSSEEPLPCYTLSLNSSNGGYAYAYPARDCYYVGTPVEISAYAYEGYEFSHWSTGETRSQITVTISGDMEITPYFTEVVEEPACYTLSVSASGEGVVNVEPEKECYEEGEIVILEAVANEGYVFSRWSDNNTSAIRTLTMDRNYQLQAVFEEKETEFDVKNLTVTNSKLNITAKWESIATRFEVTITDQNDSVVNAEVVEISDEKKVYKYKVSKYAQYTVTVKPLDADDNKIGRAQSQTITLERKYSLYISSGIGGTVNEEVNGDYLFETSVEIIATPKEGYEFFKWSDGNTSAIRTLIMDQDYELVAYFNQKDVAVEDVCADVTVAVEYRTIIVESTQSQDFALYDAVGHLLSQQLHTLSAHFRVPSAGLYILRTSNGYLKIRVE